MRAIGHLEIIHRVLERRIFTFLIRATHGGYNSGRSKECSWRIFSAFSAVWSDCYGVATPSRPHVSPFGSDQGFFFR
jgi:hypothetical protein